MHSLASQLVPKWLSSPPEIRMTSFGSRHHAFSAWRWLRDVFLDALVGCEHVAWHFEGDDLLTPHSRPHGPQCRAGRRSQSPRRLRSSVTSRLIGDADSDFARHARAVAVLLASPCHKETKSSGPRAWVPRN